MTIGIVNYKTPELTRLCLRSIRRYTRYLHEVIVVDNNSADESTEYLRSLSWSRLLEHKDTANDRSGGYAHAAALDMALAACDTEFFMSLHSDVIVHCDGWQEDLMACFQQNPQIACVGGGKCELTSPWRDRLKKATDWRTFKRRLLRTPEPLGKHRYYNRTICSIYRTDILKKEKLAFLMDRDKGYTAGKKLYFELVDGYPTVELPDRVMTRWIWHLVHAAQVINEGEFNIPQKIKRKVRRRIERFLASESVRSIQQDDSLDP